MGKATSSPLMESAHVKRTYNLENGGGEGDECVWIIAWKKYSQFLLLPAGEFLLPRQGGQDSSQISLSFSSSPGDKSWAKLSIQEPCLFASYLS